MMDIAMPAEGVFRNLVVVRTKCPSDAPDHATSEIASGGKPGIDATKKLPASPAKDSNAPGRR